MKQVLLFFAFCICSGLILGQSPDTAAIYTLADTALANKLLAEGTELNNSRKLEEAFEKLTKAGDIYKKVLGEDVVEYASVLFQLGRNRYFLKNNDEAIKFYLMALDIRLKNKLISVLDIANLYYNIGHAFSNINDYQKAIEYHNNALTNRINIFGEISPEVAWSYNSLGNIELKRNKYDDALEYYHKALLIRSNIYEKDHLDIANICYNIGNANFYKNDYENSIKFHEKALSIRIKKLGETDPDLVWSYNDIGMAYTNMKNFNKALDYQMKALEIRKKINDNENHGLTASYINIGLIYLYKSDYIQAINWHIKALQHENSLTSQDSISLMMCFNNIGTAYYYLGDYDQSLYYQNKAFETSRLILGENDSNTAFYCNNLGSNYMKKFDYEKALFFTKKAIKIQKIVLGESHIEIARSYNNLGSIYYEKQSFDSAEYYFNNALSMFKSLLHENHDYLSTSYYNLGNTYRQLGGYVKASLFYTEGLLTCNYSKDRKFELVRNIQECLMILNKFPKLHLHQYHLTRSRPHLDTAYDYAQQALAPLQYQQQSLSTDGSKAQLVENHYPVYEGAIQTSLMVADLDNNDSLRRAAFDYAEQSKAAILRAKIREGEALRFAGIPDSLLQQEYDLRVGIAWREKQRQEKLNAGQSETDSTVLAISGRLFDLRQQYDSLKARFEREHRDYYRAKYDLRTVSVADVQRSIHPGQTLLEYFVGDSSIFIFLIQPDFFDVKKVAIDASFQQRVLDMTQNGIYGYYASPKSKRSVRLKEKTTRAYATAAAELYQLLIEPFKSKLTTELIIIPDGRLGYIPFEALLTSQPTAPLDFSTYDFLLKRYQISYDYSATLFREMSDKQHRQPPANEVLAMAPFSPDENQYISHIDTTDYSPDFALRDTLAALPGSGEELNAIMKYFKGLPLLGNTATIDTFLRLASRYRILHLSTHAEADDRAGDYAYLAFSMPDNNGEFAKLYARDLYNLSLNADMVVLSACETGVGKLQRGEGIVSLARAFAFAGAKSIFTTLWKVSDEKTKDLVGAFYKYLRKEKAKDEALRLAKLEYLKKNEKTPEFLHPFFWAGMIGIGDMRPMDW